MNFSTLLWRNLSYHWRTNAAVIAGVATAVAVLAGALLVGDSVRGSLRDLVLARLGKTDSIIAGANPFRAQLAKDLSPDAYPLLALEGIVTHGSSGRAASRVAVYGVDDGFWKFHGVPLKREAPVGRTALLSPALAAELAVQQGDALVLRLDKPSEIPSESLHGRREDTVHTLRLTAGLVLPPEELGEFSLRPSQAGVRAIFVALSRLQRDLSLPAKANIILLRGESGPLPRKLQENATLQDMGVRIKALPEVNQLSLETTSMVINDALEQAAKAAARELKLQTRPVLTYLVNTMRVGDREVPYSLVTAIELPLIGASEGIVLNDWTARELAAKPGDQVKLEYYVWLAEGRLATHGSQLEVSSVVPIKGPAADRDYAPQYPGITEAKTIHDWDPPFPMNLGKIRKRDEDYWDKYRTTPKAFISIQKGQELWGTRFGRLTSMRLEPTAGAGIGTLSSQYETLLRTKLDPERMGITVASVRQEGMQAAQGSTDFGEYFLYFSFFLVVSALLLVGLFFKLGVEQRYREAGVLRAIGFPVRKIGRLFLLEGLVQAGIGSILGALFAAGYAGLILYGLRTWWVDAVGTNLLRLHLAPASLLGGAMGGLVTALLVVAVSVRGLGRPSPRALLHGSAGATGGVVSLKRAAIFAAVSALLGMAMLGAALAGRMPATGGFFGAGAMFLIATLAALRLWLGRGVTNPNAVWRLGLRNATYRPGRSVLSMALIAFATFLIVALSAFRQEGKTGSPGAGGFALVGESALPVIHNPDKPEGRQELGFPTDAEVLFQGVRVVPLRLRPGDDSSCLNLYQPRNPRILAVPDDVLFRMPLSKEKIAPRPGEIAAYVDANSLQYVLHKKQGDEIVLQPANGTPVRLRVSAAISDSIFQSEILIREADFVKAFPEQQGFRMFLVEAPAQKAEQVTTLLEERLKDYGLDLKSTAERLAEYHRVENAYLSTFQALGGLGLLLGTVGLAAVLLRNVLERRKELALLKAVGYRPSHLATLVLAENALLLLGGLGAGTLCAALAIAPAIAERGGKLPLGLMALLLLAVAITGFAASLVAVKAAMKTRLLASLRAE
ncbi:MAG TPA: ABC transporter permease [Bryobacteraceae bacterium]|nr:ABC transporter permease [Bryobacteraceae bacterium]